MRFLIGRTARTIFVVLAVCVLTFMLTTLLPGDPAQAMLGLNATEETIAQLRAEMNLDDPAPQRFAAWLGGVVQGDLGRSYLTRQLVSDSLLRALPVSLLLMFYTQLISLVVAIPLGVFTAYREGGWLDRAVTFGTFAAISIPNFVIGVFLVFVFAITLGWFDPTGYVSFSESPWGNFESLLLPALTLAIGQIAIYARVLRTDMIATLKEDYVAMARAKGLPARRILLGHALKPSSFTLLTVAGLNFAHLISGAVLVETIFNLPGLGRLTVGAITTRDYLLVQGCVLVIAIGFVVVNYLTDLSYGLLDPRIRRARSNP